MSILPLKTPVGTRLAPPWIAKKYAAMTDEEVFAAVDNGAFVEPFALAEIQRRDKLAEYYRWKEKS
jgi:hypothetical protein